MNTNRPAIFKCMSAISLFVVTILAGCMTFDAICPGCEPLESAVANNNYELFEKLLPKESDINRPLIGGNTLLHYASNLKMVKKLLENGANLDVKNNSGETPLNTAIRFGSESVALFLVNSGADVNIVVPDGSSVLSKAASRKNLELVKLIVEKGASVSQLDGRGETPLFTAAESGSEEIFHFLLGELKSSKHNDVSDNSPLFSAVKRGSYKITEALINSGYNPNTSLPNGITPILIAAYQGHEELVKRLINLGANPHVIVGKYGNTLHASILGGHHKIADFLVSINVKPVKVTNTLFSTYASAIGHQLHAEKILNDDKAKIMLLTAVELYEKVLADGEIALDKASSSIWKNRIYEVAFVAFLVSIGYDPAIIASNSGVQENHFYLKGKIADIKDSKQRIISLQENSKKRARACRSLLASI